MTNEEYMNLRRAFAMLGLAVCSNKVGREQLTSLPGGYAAEAVPDSVAAKLREKMLEGAVTCIRPNPEPFTFISYSGTFGSVRCVWGMWLERPSVAAKSAAATMQSGMLTRAQALAKGIPMPDENVEA